jgi:hypothetical protein
MPHRPNRPVLMFLFCLLSLIATARSSIAEVTRIDFTSKQPYGTFRAGDYVIWQGRIHGDLSLQEAQRTCDTQDVRTACRVICREMGLLTDASLAIEQQPPRWHCTCWPITCVMNVIGVLPLLVVTI